MVKFFKDNPTRPSRALQIWLVLISKAHNRQTLTYQQLAEILDFKGAGTLGGFLDYILRYCKRNNLPLLTSIVVNKKEGIPGEGYGEFSAADHQRVFEYNWFDVIPPSPEEFAEAHDATD